MRTPASARPASGPDVPAGADMLTELLNRRQFRAHLQAAIGRAVRNRHQVRVLYLDLDRFNIVNTLHGNQIGDHAFARKP